jgi:hypothetical protein
MTAGVFQSMWPRLKSPLTQMLEFVFLVTNFLFFTDKLKHKSSRNVDLKYLLWKYKYTEKKIEAEMYMYNK